MYLGDCGGGRSHVLPVNKDVHGVVVAPLHAHAVPHLETHSDLISSEVWKWKINKTKAGGAAHSQPVQRIAVILPLQNTVALDLRAAEKPGDLGAELWEGRGEAGQRAGRQLWRSQRGQADMQRAAPLIVHFVDPHLQEETGEEDPTCWLPESVLSMLIVSKPQTARLL